MIRKINVAHFLWKINPFAGTEKKVIQLLNHLDRNKFNPFIVGLSAPWENDLSPYLARDIQYISFEKRSGPDVRLVWPVARYLKKHHIDLVHSHNWSTIFHAVASAKLAGVPVVIHGEHGRETGEIDISLKRKIVQKILYKETDAIVTVSADLKHQIQGLFNVPDQKITLITNGVDLSLFNDPYDRDVVRYNYNLNKGITLASIASIRPVKDLHTMIRSFVKISESINDINLVIAGDFSRQYDYYKRDILSFVAAQKIRERIKFIGPIKNIPEFLSAIDIYLNSSVSEGMSNTILEAMACGVPVVATRVGGNPELVEDGVTGFLYPAGDYERCASAVIKILSDQALSARMKLQSRQKISRSFNLQDMIHKHEELYERLWLAKN